MTLGSFKSAISKMSWQIVYIWYICINTIWHRITYKTKQNQSIFVNKSWKVQLRMWTTSTDNFFIVLKAKEGLVL